MNAVAKIDPHSKAKAVKAEDVASPAVPSNLALWNSLEQTPPSATKQFSRGGGFKGTSINGTFILKRLTETFGMCGKGWRFVLDDERIEIGHTLKNGDHAKVHIVRGHLEYRDPEGKDWVATSPQFGQTMLVDENKYGTFTDEEAPKKSITDCIGKCAVQLGIGADIFLGMYDDNKYVNDRKAEEAAERKAKLTPPPAPPTELTEAEQRAIDRAGFRDMAGETEEIPTEAEIVEPHTISSSGKTPKEWGTELVAHYAASVDLGTLMDWRSKNEKIIDQLGPKAIESLAKAYKARYDAIIATMGPPENELP